MIGSEYSLYKPFELCILFVKLPPISVTAHIVHEYIAMSDNEVSVHFALCTHTSD